MGKSFEELISELHVKKPLREFVARSLMADASFCARLVSPPHGKSEGVFPDYLSPEISHLWNSSYGECWWRNLNK